MASVYYLYQDAMNIDEFIIEEHKRRAETSGREYFAAVTIQSSYRGYMTRKRKAMQIKAAKTLQRYIRGFLVRYRLPEMMQEYYDNDCLKLYDGMATKIQARWRGYWVRKYEVCIEDIIKEKKEMQKADDEMRRFFDDQRKLSLEGGDVAIGAELIASSKGHVEQIAEALFDRHHLLSTHQHRGVLSQNGVEELSKLEILLKYLPWKDYMNKVRRVYRKYWREDKSDYYFDGKRSEATLDDSDKPPFVLTRKIERVPYEPSIINSRIYHRITTNVTRESDRSKTVSDTGFDLQVFKNLALESKLPPYYLDFWVRKCNEHNM